MNSKENIKSNLTQEIDSDPHYSFPISLPSPHSQVTSPRIMYGVPGIQMRTDLFLDTVGNIMSIGSSHREGFLKTPFLNSKSTV
jgi:hypothetical protein